MFNQFIGEIFAVPFDLPLRDEWMPCDGRVLQIEQYYPLFIQIGNLYGGDGETTFALPDFRGRTPVGTGTGPGLHGIAQGQQGGSQELTLTAAQLPAHPHEATGSLAASNATGRNENPENNVFAVVAQGDGTQLPGYALLSEVNATLAPVPVSVQPTGDSQPVDILNPYLGINFRIAYLDEPGGVFPYIGEIRALPGQRVPNGWALCAGQVLPIAANRRLFELLGATFGGDGVTTFALPDYRGRAPVGMGNGAGLNGITQGQQGGLQEVVLELAQMPKHTHGATALFPVAGVSGKSESPQGNIPAIVLDNDGSTQLPAYSADSGGGSLSPTGVKVTVEPAGENQPVPLMNPFLGTRFIIALEGVFPTVPSTDAREGDRPWTNTSAKFAP